LSSRSFRTLNRSLVSVALVLSALLAAVAPAGAQYFGKNKITYREFDWQVYHSPHFDIYFYEAEREQLSRIVSLAESAYDRLSRRLDYQIQEATPLIFYATHSAFEQNNILVNFIPEGTGAFSTPARNRMVMPADLSDEAMFKLIGHELTHIFQFHILFQGSLGKALRIRPPLWVTEGMASYLAQDEQAFDRMFLRDAVVNDLVPPVTRSNPQGYFAYRLGHAVYDFIEDRWGDQGLLDFLYELRNTFTADPAPAVQRAFGVDPDEFDHDFRRWLRRKYLPALVESGEPSDFGRRFRARQSPLNRTAVSSGVVSPSGDLMAAFSTTRGQADVVLFDVPNRREIRNLTYGFTHDYEYLIAQNITVGRKLGRDLAFSPDGDTIAVFAKRESGRSLVLIDVIEGGHRRVIDLTEEFGVEQELSPAFSPDGTKVAFSAWKDGDFDIYSYDLESGELTNLTDDDLFDGSPAYSPDGRWLAFTSVVDGYQKLFRIDLQDRSHREQLTHGKSNERDAVYSTDGERIYFTSDQTDAENIYSADLETGEVVQHTNAVTGCVMPAVFEDREGHERMAYTAFWRLTPALYLADPEEATVAVGAEEATAAEAAAEAGIEEPERPLRAPSLMEFGIEPAVPAELPRFEPDIQVAVDEANEEDYHGFHLGLDNAQTVVAIDSDSTVLGQAILSWSDLIGERRLITTLTSVDRFSDFDVAYYNTARRLNWALHLYDNRDYFFTLNQDGEFNRHSLYEETGLVASVWYPFNFYNRLELGAGAIYRNIEQPAYIRNRRTNQIFQVYEPQSDAFPVVQAALVSDTTAYESWGPEAGHRIRFGADYSPDLNDGGTLSVDYNLDARQYVPLTRRSSLAFRAYGAVSNGSFRRPYWTGGLDTLRGFRFRSEVGDRVFFVNSEIRFPLIDTLALPWTQITGIRGRIFLDVGGAWFGRVQDFNFYNNDENRLEDGLSSYGFGVSAFMFGLPVNWDFAKRWDFKDAEGGFRTGFWIGYRF